MGLHTSQAETHKKLKLYICVYCKKLVICLKQIKNLHLKFHIKVPQKFRDWKGFWQRDSTSQGRSGQSHSRRVLQINAWGVRYTAKKVAKNLYPRGM